MAKLREKAIGRIQRGGPGTFVGASLLLGILVGVGAAALVKTIEAVVDLVARINDSAGNRLTVVAAVVVGLVLTWAIDRFLGPGVAGGGVGEVLTSLSLEAGYLPIRLIPGKVAATGLSLGTGGSGGREGPIVLIGAAIGSAFARYSRFGQDEMQAFVAAGAGAGIGAVFNAPIAGMLFALEVLLGSLSLRHLNAVVVVSVAASVTTHALVTPESILRSPAHTFSGDPLQLILFAVLAIVVVAFGWGFLELMHIADTKGHRLRPGWVKPAIAGLIVGLVGLAWPEALGTGQEFLQKLLRSAPPADFTWRLLLVIALAKIVTASITHGGGGSVGAFMPSMVAGGMVGSTFALAAERIWTSASIDPGAFALIGMAVMLTVVVRAPLTAILLVFELTGSYGMVLPLMLTAIIATIIADRIHPGSTYVSALRRKGIHLPQHEDRDILDTVHVRDVMAWVPTVLPATTVAELDALFAETGHHGVPVVNDRGTLVGIVTVSDLEAMSLVDDTAEIPLSSIMTPQPISASQAMPVSAALARMASLGLGRLPVVDATGKLVGMFRRESVVRAYHHALTRTTSNELYRARVNLRRNRHADFFEILVRDGSPVADKMIREISWPPEATLVSIRRQQSVLIPHGETVIRMGDELTIFCRMPNRAAVRNLIHPPEEGEEPTALGRPHH